MAYMSLAHAESFWLRYGPLLMIVAAGALLAAVASAPHEAGGVAGTDTAEGDTHCDPDDKKEGDREPHQCHCPYGCGCPKPVSLGEACVSCELGQCQRYKN